MSHKRILNYWDFFNLRKQPNFMVIGSIIGWMTNKDSIIWGAEWERIILCQLFLVRYWLLGAAYTQIFDLPRVECPEIYGDPALLLPKIYPNL